VEANVVRSLSTVVVSVLVGLVVVNAMRGEWGMALNGVVLAVGIAAILAARQLPKGQ